jgi:hypothetical protein
MTIHDTGVKVRNKNIVREYLSEKIESSTGIEGSWPLDVFKNKFLLTRRILVDPDLIPI